MVRAVDSGGLSSTAAITVTIGDENDITPSFLPSTLTNVSVLETLPPGAGIVTAGAEDGDVGETNLTFSLEGGGQELLVAAQTGAIVITEVGLDYETTTSYNLIVTVRDSRIPVRSSSIAILLLLQDVNDNPPTFQPLPPSLFVAENSTVGSEVVCVTAEDADSSDVTELSYHIVGGNEGERFDLDSNTGCLTTAAALDREEVEEYHILIEVRVCVYVCVCVCVSVCVFVCVCVCV